MRYGVRIVTVALALALIGTLLMVPQGSVLASPVEEADMLELINGARANEGLAALIESQELLPAAEAQTDAQIAAGTIFHTADLGSVASGWQALGENVGVGPNMPLLHDAFMDSPGHRANILGDYNQIAISAKQASSGQFYITLIFMQKALPATTTQTGIDVGIIDLEPGSIEDIAESVFEVDIEWLAEQGIAIACNQNETSYCPSHAITRGEMATMMARALDLAASPTDFFTDDNESDHEDDINAMAAAGVTLGCDATGSKYCPEDTLTRAQMASFFARAFELADPGVDYFADDGNSVHESNINALAHAEITVGCNPPTNDQYCGPRDLTRGHIAAFIKRALT